MNKIESCIVMFGAALIGFLASVGAIFFGFTGLMETQGTGTIYKNLCDFGGLGLCVSIILLGVSWIYATK